MEPGTTFATAQVAPYPKPSWFDPILFAGKALASPRRVGALFPSGAALGRVMARMVQGRFVVELGPGSGSITRHLLARLPEQGHLLALELDRGMASRVSHQLNDPRLSVRIGDAADLPEWLAVMGWKRADTIVSGLPFQALPEAVGDRILAAAKASLAPGGRFIAFQYGLRLLPTFQKHFSRVRVIGPVWLNLPPAYVIVGLP